MAMQALYRGGKRNSASYYRLRLTTHSTISKPKGVMVSRTLYDKLLVQSSDLIIKPDHIRVGQNQVTPLSINLRRNPDRSGRSNNPIFVSNVDLAKLAVHFGVSIEAFNGFFFKLKPGTTTNSRHIEIKPLWSELLNPEWRDAFIAWVASQGPLPTPSKINWSPYGDAFLPMPASGFMLNFADARHRITNSWLKLKSKGAVRIGHFGYKIGAERHIKVVHFSPERAAYSTELGMVATNESFDSGNFTALFGNDKSSREYMFNKRAGKEGMPLGNVGRDSFRILNKRIFNFGSELFSLRFKRIGDRVLAEVMDQKNIEKVLAAGYINLDPARGLPFTNSMSVSINLLGIEQAIPKNMITVNQGAYKKFLSLLLRVYASDYSSIVISTKQQKDGSYLVIKIKLAGEIYEIEAKHPNNLAAKLDEVGIKEIVVKARPDDREIAQLVRSIFDANGILDASPDIEIRSSNGNGRHPLWKPSLFGLLFGEKPAKAEYTFLKMGRKQGITFGQIGHHRSPFLVSGYKFEVGKPYLFRASREGNAFILEVLDLNTKEELAEGFVELNEKGFPKRRTIKLEAFEE